MIHFYAGAWSHYTDHMAPIWNALPDDLRGDFYVRHSCTSHIRAKELGIETKKFRQFTKDELVLVASFEDYRACKPAQIIFLNHGVGQTYGGDPKSANMSSYSGGSHRERTVLFLCPSERDAEINRFTYPSIPAIPIGVPYLDGIKPDPTGPIVISFHGNIHTCPETRWAWPWIKGAIMEIAHECSREVVGHSHPRARSTLEPWWGYIGVRFEPDWQTVLRTAGCYVIDNSSSGYEAAALGIPTVWLNPPHYRKNVHHGLRFWDAIPGMEVNDPLELVGAIELSLQNPFQLQIKRDLALKTAYADADGNTLVDGHATERAVTALCQLTSGSLPSVLLS